MKIKLPAVISDIDGVLLEGVNPIKGATRGLQMLLKPYQQSPKFSKFSNSSYSSLINQSNQIKFPFICLTNGGNFLESEKAEQINTAHCLNKYKLNSEQMILNFTPFLQEFRENQFNNKKYLLVGRSNVNDIATKLGLKYFINNIEYCSLIRQLYDIRLKNQNDIKDIRKMISQRLRISQNELTQSRLIVDEIFFFSNPQFWEDNIQAIIFAIKQKQLVRDTIKIVALHNDLLYKDEHPLVRFALGSFITVLKNIYKELYNQQLQIIFYGKPELNTYKYAEQHIKKNFPNVEITNYYMIGDNPQSDIRGANSAGWKSLLVKTGVFQNKINDNKDPATYVVNDFSEAIEKIFELENIHTLFKYQNFQ